MSEAAPIAAANSATPTTTVSQVVEHLFREEAGKMVATLTRIFGLEHLALAEDVVQGALARALETWPFYGVPQNPSAWLMRTARNLALDVVRRVKVFHEKQADIIEIMDPPGFPADAVLFSDEEIADDRLRMMFVCCHPLIPLEAQIALALNTLCGFGIAEISRAFLCTESATAKRLTRAKHKIRQAGIPFEIPAGPELASRLDGVLKCLYLLFNEGYKASSGAVLVRDDVCQEAIRLAGLLAQHPAGNQPKTHALAALMLMNAARFPTRADALGNLLPLHEQDRTRWDQSLIARGMFHFAQSADGEALTVYHLEAAIAACHCAAQEYAATDWRQILSLYDRLLEFEDSPVVALNRAVAVANVHGAGAGLAALEAVPDRRALESYHLFYAVQGEFEQRCGNFKAAAAHFHRSRELTSMQSERAFLSKRIAACEAADFEGSAGTKDEASGAPNPVTGS